MPSIYVNSSAPTDPLSPCGSSPLVWWGVISHRQRGGSQRTSNLVPGNITACFLLIHYFPVVSQDSDRCLPHTSTRIRYILYIYNTYLVYREIFYTSILGYIIVFLNMKRTLLRIGAYLSSTWKPTLYILKHINELQRCCQVCMPHGRVPELY